MNVAVFADEALERFGDFPSVTYVSLTGPDTIHSSRALHDTAVRLSSALGDLGISAGDRVLVMIPNAPEIGAIYTAIARCGAVIVPVLFLLADAEVRHIVADAEPAAVITSSEFHAKVAGVPGVRHVICVDGPAPEGTTDLTDLVGSGDPDASLVDRDPSDLALLIYTGGTTGRPKGVMLTHGNLTFAAEGAARVASDENGIGHDDVSCSALPLAHSYGFLVWLVSARIGGRTVLMRWFEPSAWLRSVETYRCTTSPMVPTMITYLLNQPDADDYDTSSLRVVNSGAAPLPVDVGRAFEERFGCAVLEGWGLTESIGYGTVNRIADRRRGSIGRPGPGVEIAVRDPSTGRDLGPGGSGELMMRGRHVMAGYWNRPDDTAETIRDGWLRTGDVGHIDDDGFVYIVDRTNDLIVRGGFNVYPRNVEEVLAAHPAVLEAAVVGVADPAMGEDVKAFVVLRPGADASEDDLLEHCREHLATYETPRSVAFIDALPKSGVGKVLRRELRDGTASAGA